MTVWLPSLPLLFLAVVIRFESTGALDVGRGAHSGLRPVALVSERVLDHPFKKVAEDLLGDPGEKGSEFVLENPWVLALVPLATIGFVAILVGFCWCLARPSAALLSHEQEAEQAAEAPTGLGEAEAPPVFGNALMASLPLVPLGIAAHLLGWPDVVSFVLNCASLVPLAYIMSTSISDLSVHFGHTTGGLMGAAFGNIVELLLAIQTVRRGLVEVTKAALLGSVLVNSLLVLGIFLFLASWSKRRVERTVVFDKESAHALAELVLLSSFSVALPSFFARWEQVEGAHVLPLSRATAIFMVVLYCAYLVFHAEGEGSAAAPQPPVTAGRLAKAPAVGLVVGATLLTAICTDGLASALVPAATSLGASPNFLALVLLPVLGNAASFATALTAAHRSAAAQDTASASAQLDLGISTAMSGATQVALMVLPGAVVFGWLIGQPMTLDFGPLFAFSLVAAAFLMFAVLSRGRANWLEGIMLVNAYLIFAFLCFFAPP